VQAQKAKMRPEIHILPYSLIVGQEKLKLALELTYIAPRIGGVLVSGHRGTGKSTAVRAFALMMHGELPVTLPINATEDRVVGGWQIDELMRGEAVPQPGLLEEAGDKGMLFVDEVNLLDDHIVNIILDVTATGVLVIQREGLRSAKPVSFALVGTMNPEEGGLRPQLLDRFGLMVGIKAETDETRRGQILKTVLDFDQATRKLGQGQPSEFIENGRRQDNQYKARLKRARNKLDDVAFPDQVARACVKVASEFQAEGHRGDYVMALAARARAALNGAKKVSLDDLKLVAPLALQHRRPEVLQRGRELWTSEDDRRMEEILSNV
jgi:magnesium chelatase subunit I